MKMKLPRRTWYIIGTLAVLVFLFANAGSRRMIRRYFEIHRLRAELVQLKRENDLLKKEVYFLEQDPSYIERIARRELGLVAPGEVEYRFQ